MDAELFRADGRTDMTSQMSLFTILRKHLIKVDVYTGKFVWLYPLMKV